MPGIDDYDVDSTTSLESELSKLEKVNKVLDLYHLARDKKKYYYDLWRRNYMLVHSRMWGAFPSSWQPSPTDNEIYPCLATVVGWMTDQHIDFSVNGMQEPNTPNYEMASGLSRALEVCLRSNWEEQDWVSQVKLALWDGTIYGTGIMKSQWNSSLEMGKGNAELVRCDPWTIYPDPQATSFKDCSYIIEVKKMTMDELERKYPEHHDLISRGGYDSTEGDNDAKPSITNVSNFPLANPGAISPSTSASYGLPGQSRRTAVVEPGVYVYECWYQQNEDGETQVENEGDDKGDTERVVYARWRVAVMAQGTILMDEYAEDLYGIDRHPYSRLCFDDLGEFWGMSLATHVAPCQIAINRLLSALQQNAELVGNPIFLEPQNAGISRTSIINRPGTRLPYSTQSNKTPEWMQPPSMPPVVKDLIEFWIGRMENIAGINEVQKGKTPAPRTTAKQTGMAQESGFVRIRAAQSNLESCLKDAGTILATLIINNYNEPRLVSLTGDGKEGQMLKLAAKHFYLPDPSGQINPLRFTLVVDAGSDQPTSRMSRISEADTLAAMGMIDQQAVLEAHNYPGAQIIIERMAKAKQQAAAAGLMEQGGPGARVRAKRTS